MEQPYRRRGHLGKRKSAEDRVSRYLFPIFLNNFIRCISWHEYFYFRALDLFHFTKRFKFGFEISFRIILKVLRLKPCFKFEYLNQIPNPQI
jgi:hypothetical protein